MSAPSFRRIIEQAYQQILGRGSDPAGLAAWQSAMEGGMAEWAVREAFIRSAEYAEKNPGTPTPPTPGTMSPLRVEGNRFVNASGPVKLLGMVIAGDDPNTPGHDEGLEMGWPLVNAATLDLMASHRLNYTVMRLGPNIDRAVFGEGEGAEFCGYLFRDGKYDLDQWEPAFWARLRAAISHARDRGIYVCLSLIDSWNLDHEVTPWTASRNHQGYDGGSLEVVRQAPSARHRTWVDKVGLEVGAFENVIAIDGNESFKGHVSKEWCNGIGSEWVGPRLFGTNSGLDVNADFVVMHDRDIPQPGGQPIIVDEYPERPVDAILADCRLGWELGSVAYMYWRGDTSLSEMHRCLDGLTAIVDGTAPPWPATCPTLTKMGIAPLQWMDQNFNPLPGPAGARRGRLDLTPKFGNPPRPCNNEHTERCQGRPCEDPRGGSWELLQQPGGATWRVENDGFLFRIDDMTPGNYRVRCSPWPDSHDALGKPLTIGPNAPQEFEWVV